MKLKTAVLVMVTVGCGNIPADTTGGGGGTHSASGGGSSAGGGAAGGSTAGTGGGTEGAISTELYTAGVRLKVRSLVGTDGSRQQAGLWDSARNEACGFMLASDGKMRCLVSADVAMRVEGWNWYVDAGCSVLAFVLTTCGAPKYGIDYLSTSCPTRHAVHTLDPTPLSTIFSLSGTTCGQATKPAGWGFFKSTGIIAPTTFVAAELVTE